MTDGRMDRDDVELTDIERAALANLPREKEASDLLETRVVRELEARGVLERGGGRTREAPREATGPRRGIPVWAAAAAGFALFLFGGLAGHRLGARGATDALLAVREQDAVLRVQALGSAYVRALAALEARAADAGPEADRGHEVATTTLAAAASVTARLDPDDALAPLLVEMLDRRVVGDTIGRAVVHRTFSF